MISLTAPRFPRDARVPCFDSESARGFARMSELHGIPLSMGGSSLEPEHEVMAPPRASADAVTVAPRRALYAALEELGVADDLDSAAVERAAVHVERYGERREEAGAEGEREQRAIERRHGAAR